MTIHTMHRFLHWRDIFTPEYGLHGPEFSGGSYVDATCLQSGRVGATHGGRIGNRLYGVWKRNSKKLLEARSEIDGRALVWTCESLDEDQELEHFFAGVPGFCTSKASKVVALIHFTHQFVRNLPETGLETFSLNLISTLGTNYNVPNALAGIKHDFCSLWNEIVLQERDTSRNVIFYALVEVRPIHVAVHRGSTLDGEHQLCSITSHRMGPASNLDGFDDGRKVEAVRAPITSPVPSASHLSLNMMPSFTFVKSGSRNPTPGGRAIT
jgi:hypothetical protein